MTDNLEPLLRASILQAEERKTMNGSNGAGPAVSPASPVPTAISQPASVKGNGTAPDVYRAINQISKVLSRDGIAKSRRNEQQGYGFRGVDDVMNALSALLAGADLIILPRMRSRTQEERTTAAGKSLFYVTVRACFDFVSARDGSCHTVIMYGEAMDSADKATNKAMSAAYKYACLQVFCIPTEGMGDADQTTPVPEPKPAPKPVAVVTPKPPAREKQPAPWVNRGQMKAQFGRIRERVGEVTYLGALAKYGVTIELNWRDAAQALQCFEELVELAVA